MPKPQEQEGSNRLWTWSDALVAAPTTDDMWVITSPNMDFVPSPPVGRIKVVLRSDCRYGLVDPIQHPQVYSEGWEYLCMISRPDARREQNDALSFTPSRYDFVLHEGSIIKCLGLLREDVLRPLSAVVKDVHRAIADSTTRHPHLAWLDLAMTDACDRLRSFPCTFRDVVMQVRETQRYCLMARAFLDFRRLEIPAAGTRPRPVNPRLMGAFTTNPALVQRLFSAGVPVWYVRTDVSILADDGVRAVVMIRPTTDICTDIGQEDGHVLYTGLVGPKHLAAMARGGHTYLDISRAPLLAVEQDGGYSAAQSQKAHKREAYAASSQAGGAVRGSERGNRASRGQSSGTPYPKVNPTQVRGVNKFLPTEHAWMPEPLTTWKTALAAVDLSGRAKPQSEMWGYWIPEPGLLLRPKTEDRLHRYVVNWVRLRPAWLYLLRLREARVTRVPTQWWRDILYGSTGHNEMDETSRKAQRWREIEDVFGMAFDRVDFEPSPSGAPRWFDQTIHSLQTSVCRMIIWEVCELGFRHELLALDRLLVPLRGTALTEEHREALLGAIFPDRGIYNVHELPTPQKDLGIVAGLWADLPHLRVRSLEAFRQVLARWPRCPPAIHAASTIGTQLSPKDILAREAELVSYYVNTFFEYSGRAPIVPHRFPITEL